MRQTADRLFVVTGGPGSGKTSLLSAAAACGHAVWPEAGRAIIQSQLAIGGRALPWADKVLYGELMLDRDMQTYAAAAASGTVALCDRGVADMMAYARLNGLPEAAHMRAAAELFRYNNTVFFAPPWREIYVQDAERKQGWDEAVRTFEALLEVYEALAYRIVELPRASVEERLDFVVGIIAHA